MVPQLDGTEELILIDCGKTFREQAIKIFPQKRFRKIDACILTREFGDRSGYFGARRWLIGFSRQTTTPMPSTDWTT